MTRCVNLDWLEVHCLEPLETPHDARFFREAGFYVEEREYGTRVYREMFTLFDQSNQAFLEVRRNPASQGLNGIHAINECHLRLTNIYCYKDNAADIMRQFIDRYGYQFRRISRVDICLDFEKFDKGDDPQIFLRRYLRRRFSKINQTSIRAHGSDTWSGQEWNSVSWGSPSSDIGTKFYNKTLELFEPTTKQYRKPYIRYAWFKSGLVDDWQKIIKYAEDGTAYTPQIWRVEFSIRSSVKKWFKIELNGKAKAYQSIHNTLDCYDSRAKLLTMFAALSAHYFHFKHFEEGKRKDRCEDKVLFEFTGEQFTYKIDKDVPLADRVQTNPYAALAARLRDYRQTHADEEIRAACSVILRCLDDETYRYEFNSPFSRRELQALRLVMQARTSGDNRDAAVLLSEIKQILSLNDNTIVF